MGQTSVATARVQLAPIINNGVCPDDPAVLPVINEACERLVESGKWKGMIRLIRMCHRAGVLTLPREVETVLAASKCGVPFEVTNQWFSFLPGGPFNMSECNPWNMMTEYGTNWATVFDITGVMLVRVYNDLSIDDGKAILLQGTNGDGNRVQTLQDGIWNDGEVVICNNANPPVTLTTWTNIEAVQKELTTGYVRIYQVNPDTMQNAGLLAEYHPNDTEPTFRRYKYGGYCQTSCDGETSGQKYHPFTFLCKIRHVPLVRETDILPITAPGAMKNMCQAIWMEKNNNLDLAAQYEARAVQYLQNELKQAQGSRVGLKSVIPGFGYGPPVRSFR